MVASLQGSMGTGTKRDESHTGHICSADFHHVMGSTHLARVLKLMNHLFLLIFQIFFYAAVNRRYRGPPVYKINF